MKRRTLAISVASLLAALGCQKGNDSRLSAPSNGRDFREQRSARQSEPGRDEPARNDRRGKLVRLPTAGDAAADALARIGDAALPALIEALDSDHAATRARAARAIGQMGASDVRAIESLAAALDDPAPEVREQAARALGHIGPPAKAAIPALIKLLPD